ncbi:hypothetical protein ACGF0K_35965 [Streptomyces sp. NPDC048156]|uniref:hypothetical protein n=1 Tax=Streptomyces sp. NPDC048156 TaxID=3365502 RepID=UPI0037143875
MSYQSSAATASRTWVYPKSTQPEASLDASLTAQDLARELSVHEGSAQHHGILGGGSNYPGGGIFG